MEKRFEGKRTRWRRIAAAGLFAVEFGRDCIPVFRKVRGERLRRIAAAPVGTGE